MPLYVYKCNNCEHQFEVRQRFSDDSLTDCPNCQGEIRRVINPVGIVFKGSGFYVTDTRNGKKSALVNGSASSTSEDKGEKSETTEKSAKKAEDSSASPSTVSKSETTSAAKSAGASA